MMPARHLRFRSSGKPPRKMLENTRKKNNTNNNTNNSNNNSNNNVHKDNLIVLTGGLISGENEGIMDVSSEFKKNFFKKMEEGYKPYGDIHMGSYEDGYQLKQAMIKSDSIDLKRRIKNRGNELKNLFGGTRKLKRN